MTVSAMKKVRHEAALKAWRTIRRNRKERAAKKNARALRSTVKPTPTARPKSTTPPPPAAPARVHGGRFAKAA